MVQLSKDYLMTLAHMVLPTALGSSLHDYTQMCKYYLLEVTLISFTNHFLIEIYL